MLHAAFRHDPRDPDQASGADYQFAQALLAQGFAVSFSQPVVGPPWLLERLLRRAFRRLTGRSYTKFPLSLLGRARRELDRALAATSPDVIFTLFPPPLVFYRGKVPAIYRLDTCFRGWQAQYPEFGALGFALSCWQEQRALARATRVLTHSTWTAELLTAQYSLPQSKIRILPNPAALPRSVIPTALDPKRLAPPYRLLFVGRDPQRKGLDLALATLAQLRAEGLPCELTVCGARGPHADGVTYVGPFRKSIPQELAAYVALYREAHLLLHPARFDPSPIVVAEAAAWGTPTITNCCGGMASTVKDGETGVVLPQGSPAAGYAAAIRGLLAAPEHYLVLHQKTRARFAGELNWDVVGRQLGELVREVGALFK